LSTRAYILLDVIEGKAEEAAETLRSNRGVKLTDVMEGRPNVVIVLQARSRRELAELTNRVLALVEGVTEDVQVLPTANGCDMNSHTKHYKAKNAASEQYLKSTGAEEG
jgi:hypothetical protein